MNETRAGKYGRFLGIFINDYIQNILPSHQQPIYKSTLINELKTYSFEQRKKGTPKSSGCIWELETLQSLNSQNPEHLAGLIKEGIHLMCQEPSE